MTSSPLLPKRILMTADTLGGVWTYAVELSRALRPHKIQVLLATMGAALSEDQREEIAPLVHVEVRSAPYKLEWMENPWDDVDASARWLLDLEKRFNPDLIHLNGYAHAGLDWRAPTLVVGHSCVLSWWHAVRKEDAPASWNEYRRRVTRGLQKADLVVAPTRAMLRALEFHYGPLGATEVIRNGRDSSSFAVGSKEPFILSAERLWDQARNTAALVAVAPWLPWPVMLAGQRKRPDGTEAHLRNVRLLGRLSARELAALYARASIYALPARYEPFGHSILEAALSGCALVLGDIPSLRETWDDAAIFVPPSDHTALEQAILDLIAHPGRLNHFAGRARERGRQMSAERMAADYLEAYQRLALPSPPASNRNATRVWREHPALFTTPRS